MSDRGPFGRDPDPTEVFPPLREDAPTPAAGLPPIGSERDPEPTRVMDPLPPSDAPTTVMPGAGGPRDPGPPYGGGGGGGGGGDEPFGPEPDPWYRQPGPLAALIAGVAALIVALIAVLVWAGDDDGSSDDTLPTVSTTSTTTTPTTEPPATSEPATTTTSSTTSTTSSTTSTTSTTTTLPPTTTTESTTTTAAPTTQATTTTVPQPTAWDVIAEDDDLTQFAQAIEGSGVRDLFEGSDEYTILAPTNDAFENAAGEFVVEDYVIPGALSAAELFQLSEVETVSGALLAVDSPSQSVGGAVVSARRDIAASNGTVQVINGLVTPTDD